MKNLLIGLLAVGSVSSFAAEKYQGVDEKGRDCSLTIIEEVSIQHDSNDSEEILNRRGYTSVEKVSFAQVSYKKGWFNRNKSFGPVYVSSHYNTMWNAYELYRSEGYSGSDINQGLNLPEDKSLTISEGLFGEERGAPVKYTYGDWGSDPDVICEDLKKIN